MLYTLRLTQITESQDRYSIEVALEGAGLPRQTTTAHLDFKLTAQDRENLRWYLEEFLQYPLDPAPKIASRIEGRIGEIGKNLFKGVFQASDDARDLWATLRERINETRVEIISGVREAATIPWELMCDPKTDSPLALRASAFVRAHPQPTQRPQLPSTDSGPIRILLVICRPGGRDDVPFRSVASRLIKGLSATAHDVFQLDVLRPPTFEQLAHVLRAAKAEGQPYHVVHFDGHGVYIDEKESSNLSSYLRGLSTIMLSGLRTGPHGYLLFENPADAENGQLVDGTSLGKLLAETHAPVLVLNACRSAHADPQETPAAVDPSVDDSHAKVRAFGSLAHEVMDAGAAGVVAMRYNVYVVTAAQFVADMYAALTQGQTLGEAVSLGRKQLAAQPLREIAFDPHPLQDWCVPIVYEVAPIRLFPKPTTKQKLSITLNTAAATPARGEIDPKLPPSPDVGFFGRDEVLLALDRAFDTQSVVLLYAQAGSGKTATAAEFARWYSLTGGVEGPVLFTSFEQYRPLARVLDQIEKVFGQSLEAAGVHWLALSDQNRYAVALQVLKQIPVLWVWDNIEPIAGFPISADSAWSGAEQKELVDFLRKARETRAKFLLTSRRGERGWLGDLPARVTLPPMPMQERVQLTRALAEKHGRRLTDVDDWRPLLKFTKGNPLTITVLARQALRDGLKTEEQIEAFVQRLRTGEEAFEDEIAEGRSKALGASLSYGFEHAFNQEEFKYLAPLHLFQGFVNVDVLCSMTNTNVKHYLPNVRSITRDDASELLRRAAEVGLLEEDRNGNYSIHPAIPWYFRMLFDQHYADSRTEAIRAFASAMAYVGGSLALEYDAGNLNAVQALIEEEENLLHTWRLARNNGWWTEVISTMNGLRRLYSHTGRAAEWARIVNTAVPDLVDPASDGPLPGREQQWSFITDYRVRLLCDARKWKEAESLQRICVDWDRQHATAALAIEVEQWEVDQRQTVWTLAQSLDLLGDILREQSKPDCVAAYDESIKLAQLLREKVLEHSPTYKMGHSYLGVPAICDLEKAEYWYRRSLDLYSSDDRFGRAGVMAQLGMVVHARFNEAKFAMLDYIDSELYKSRSNEERFSYILEQDEELLGYLNTSEGFYKKALSLTPQTALNDLAIVHDALGRAAYEAFLLYDVLYLSFKEAASKGFDFNDVVDEMQSHKTYYLDLGLTHYKNAIRYAEATGLRLMVGQSQFNLALLLKNASRLEDALEYTYASLPNLQAYGDSVAEELIIRAKELIEELEQALITK